MTGEVGQAPASVDDFVRDAAAAGASAPVVDLEVAGLDLLRRWSDPERGYHDGRHLAEVLARLEQLEHDGHGPAGEPVVRLAAWFHDAVYRGRAGQDEQSSADLARRLLRALGVPLPVVERVADLVLVTRDHRASAGDDAAAALCDTDLAVLAAPRSRYLEYVAGVRAEHPELDDRSFAAGRAAVLADLLARPSLFATAAGRRRWEDAARRQAGRELAALRRDRPVEDDVRGCSPWFDSCERWTSPVGQQREATP